MIAEFTNRRGYDRRPRLPVLTGRVVESRSVDTPSLGDDRKEFRTIVDQLWNSGPGPNVYGQGKVYGSQTLAEALEALQVAPDFEYTKPQHDMKLLVVHRTLPDGEVYWVNNRNDLVETFEATFRVEGKAAELRKRR